MTRDRHRSRLFRSDPAMLLLGEEPTPASTASVDAPEPRGVRVRSPAGEVSSGPLVVGERVTARAAPVMERVTGGLLGASAAVFDEGYESGAGEPPQADTPLRIYVGSPNGQIEDLSGLGRVWDASSLAVGAPGDDEPLAGGGWEDEGATEPVETVPSTSPPGHGGRWVEPDEDDPFAPPKEGRWAAAAVDDPSMRRQPEEEWKGGVYDEVDVPSGAAPNWGGGGSGRGDLLRPLAAASPAEPPGAGDAGDAGDWQLSDEEASGGMPSWALEPELPPPPPIRMGGPSRLERELSRHWDADEQSGLDGSQRSGAGQGSGVREPWDVTVSGAWRRPAHLSTGETRRPAHVVPEFRHLDDEPDASRWTKISAAALSVVLVCVVALQFGSDKPVMMARGDLLDVAWAGASGSTSPAAGPRAAASAASSAPASRGASAGDSEPASDAASGSSAPPSPSSAATPASLAGDAPGRGEAHAERRVAPVFEDTGRLTVTTDFPATVYVDGKRVGTTPLDPLDLSVGMHDVKVVPRGGGRPRTARARVDLGRAAEVSFSR